MVAKARVSDIDVLRNLSRGALLLCYSTRRVESS